MIDAQLQENVATAITAATGARFHVRDTVPVGGGCINASYCVRGHDTRFFVKTNTAARLPAFVNEAAGLRALAATGTLRVPAPLCWGATHDAAYLVLEHLEFGTRNSDAALGRGLAALHRVHGTRYGWEHDRRGGTPGDDWVEFWRTQRLGPQLERARDNGYAGRLQDQGARVLEGLAKLLAGHRPPASLLHGDLWSGNAATLANGEPVVFDPAAYYGDRETDLALTELFGGFGQAFYSAYHAAYPLSPGYTLRKDVYNLYHVLNHLNLFGGGYRAQAEALMTSILRHVPA
jgi:protein-ribulosamine 3-kinase